MNPIIFFKIKENSSSEEPVVSEQNSKEIIFYLILQEFMLCCFRNYIHFRQYSVLKNKTSVPPEMTEVMDETSYTTIRLNHLKVVKFDIFLRLVDLITDTVFLYFNGFHTFWSLSEKYAAYFYWISEQNEIIPSVLFVVINRMVDMVVYLPVGICRTLIIKKSYRSYNQIVTDFIDDTLQILAVAISLIPFVVFILKTGHSPITIWLLFGVLLFWDIFAWVYRHYQNCVFTQLPEGTFKNRVKELVESVNFPIENIYVFKGKEAYYDSSRKGIFLSTSLLGTSGGNSESEIPRRRLQSEDELLAVVAHELGHWKLSHGMKLFIKSKVFTFLWFFVFCMQYQNQSALEAFEFWGTPPVIINIAIAVQFAEPYYEVSFIFENIVSQWYESQADAFAKQLNKSSGLRSSLAKSCQNNFLFPDDDWLYSFRYNSHPPFLQRIRALA